MRHFLLLFAFLLSGVVSAQIQVMPVIAQGQTQSTPTPPGLPTPNLWINGSDSTNYTHSVDIGGRIIDQVTTSDPNAYTTTSLSSGNIRFKPSNNREAQYFNGQSGYTLGSASTFKYYHGGGAWTAYVTIKQLPMASSSTQWNILKTIGITTTNTTVGLNIAYRNLTGTAVKTVRVALMNGAGGATGPFDVTCSNNSIIDNEYNILKIVFTGSALRVYVINSANPTFTLIGSDLSGSGLSSADAAAPLNVGGTAAWTGYLKQVIFYDHNLTSGDEIDAENWIAADVLKVKVPQPANVYFIFGQSNVFGYSTSTNAQLPAYITGDLGTYTFWDAANSDANKIAFWDNYVVGQRTNPGVANENGALPRFAYDMKQKGIQTWFIVRGIGSTKMLPDGVVPSWSSDTTVSAADHYPIFTDRFTSDGLEEIEHVYRKTPVIKGLIKMQGETDAGDPANSTTPSIAAKTKYRYTKQWYAWCVNFVNYLNTKGYNTTSMRIANPRVHNLASGAWPEIQAAETNVMDSLRIKYPSLPIEHSQWIDTDNLNWSAPHYYYDGYDSIGKRLARYFINPIPVPPVSPSDAITDLQTYNANGNTTYLYTRFPSGTPKTKYPVIVMAGGDGVDNHFSSIVTNQSVTCVGTACSGNFVSASNNKVLAGTVVVKQNGTEIAHGYEGGLLNATSAGITTGSMDIASNNGAFSFTLASGGGTITISYKCTIMASESALKYINEGDGVAMDAVGEQIGGAPAIIAQVQNYGNDVDYTQPYYFQNVITALETKFPGKLDYKRIYWAGTSRGSRGIRMFLEAHEDSVDAVIYATRDYPATEDFTAMSNMVRLNIMGSSDASALSPKTPWTSIGASTNQNTYSKVLIPWGVGHFSTLWNNLVYSRATAPFDWYLELMKGSRDLDTRAVLMVDAAQYSEDIEDYREALMTVNLMTAGATKTSLLSDLSTLKGVIDSGRKRYIIDLGTSANTTSGNYNNMTNLANGQTLSALIDDTGSSSSFAFNVTNAFSATTTEAALTSTYANTTFYGLPKTFNIDGMVISEVGNATITGLTAGKAVTVKLYFNEVSTNYTYRAGASVIVEGSATTFYDCQHNSLQKPLTFTTTVGVDNDIDIQIQPRDLNRPIYCTGIEFTVQN